MKTGNTGVGIAPVRNAEMPKKIRENEIAVVRFYANVFLA